MKTTPALPCGIEVMPTTERKPDYASSSSSGMLWDSAEFSIVSTIVSEIKNEVTFEVNNEARRRFDGGL